MMLQTVEVTCKRSKIAHPKSDTCKKPKETNLVHGIVSVDPPQIQCDGCGAVAEGESGKFGVLVFTCGIIFSPQRFEAGDYRRLCRECRAVEWPETVR